jgi:hypothetical protein
MVEEQEVVVVEVVVDLEEQEIMEMHQVDLLE